MPTPADRPEAGRQAEAAPRSNRGIIGLGVLICIIGAIIAAWLLGLLDRIGLLS
jgi:hypothetical protein